MTAHSHFIEVCEKCRTVINQCRCMGPKTEKPGLCDDCKPPGVPKSWEVRQRILEEFTREFSEPRAERLLQAVKTKPSYPNPVDEYKPTDENLWKIVLEVASGKRLEFRRNDRTIHSPNGTRGYRNMPNNPQGIAWAVKQYNGFGANWKNKSEAKEAMWNGLVRMAAGGVEITEGTPLKAAEALSDGLVRLASQVGTRCYWDLTEKGYGVVMAKMKEDLVRKVDALLLDYKQDEAQRIGSWIESSFLANAAQTSPEGRALKEALQGLVWPLKNHTASQIKSDWDGIKPKLSALIQAQAEADHMADLSRVPTHWAD